MLNRLRLRPPRCLGLLPRCAALGAVAGLGPLPLAPLLAPAPARAEQPKEQP